MATPSDSSDRPAYDRGMHGMITERGSRATDFATQILDTTAPFVERPRSELHVLDVGCGYGHTTVELARHCERVVGIEPSNDLYAYACSLRQEVGLSNLTFRPHGIYEHTDRNCYDLVILDNVLEHLSDQPRALHIISSSLRPGGVAYILVPNKIWPIEAHYRLPFLSYLPLRLANRYLRLSGRGTDYTDASYSPTYCSLNRMLRSQQDLSFAYVLPKHLEMAQGGGLHYRLGAALIRRIPWFWAVSKALLVVATKREAGNG